MYVYHSCSLERIGNDNHLETYVCISKVVMCIVMGLLYVNSAQQEIFERHIYWNLALPNQKLAIT